MDLETYFDFLAPDDIRVQGSRIGIESILYEYIHRRQTPEAIAVRFPTLTLEQVYATILYYLRNQAQVERRLKEAMKNDRARVQIGRISPFGLLELSRQRMRPSVIETSFEPCPMCSGTGTTRTIESAALALLRRIEDEGIRHQASEVVVTAGSPIALYLLNHKRRALSMIEERYGFAIRVVSDPALVGHEFKLDRLKTATAQPTARVDRPELTSMDTSASVGLMTM